MAEESEMKLICEYPVGTLRNAVAINNVAVIGQALRVMPGIGKPFLIFQSLPGQVVMADFDLHSDWAGHGNVVTGDAAKNAEMVQAMLDNPPMDAVTFAE